MNESVCETKVRPHLGTYKTFPFSFSFKGQTAKNFHTWTANSLRSAEGEIKVCVLQGAHRVLLLRPSLIINRQPAALRYYLSSYLNTPLQRFCLQQAWVEKRLFKNSPYLTRIRIVTNLVDKSEHLGFQQIELRTSTGRRREPNLTIERRHCGPHDRVNKRLAASWVALKSSPWLTPVLLPAL